MRRSAVQSSWNDHRVNRSGRALFNARSTHARANYDFVRQANRARAKQRPTNSRSWGTWRELQAKPLKWWAHKGSNLGPLPCEGNALPLSYAPGRSKRGPIRAAIYEAGGAGVKPGLSPFVVPADAPGHRHNDPSSSAEADDPVFSAISARYPGPR